MRDRLPKRIHKNETGIVNLDDYVGRGSHWTSYIKKYNYVKYFDSMGNLKPPIEVIKYLKTDPRVKDIYYNSSRYQSVNSLNCGHLCLMFLYTNTQR